MFFRLPFPDIARMEKLHQSMKISADVFSFLGDMEDDLKQPRAMEDLRRGWKDFLETEMPSSGFGQHNLGKCSQSKRRQRNKTPTTSEDEKSDDDSAPQANSKDSAGSSLEAAQVCLL
jgi:hypothetical protein